MTNNSEPSTFVGAFVPTPLQISALFTAMNSSEEATVSRIPLEADCLALEVRGLVSGAACDCLQQMLVGQRWEPAGIDGYRIPSAACQPLGSWRVSWFSEELATALWARLYAAVPRIRTLSMSGHADWDDHPSWRAIGVNPLIRFIRYEPGCELIAHYDGPYIWDTSKRTLMSLIIYLSDILPGQGGHTRMLKDPQSVLPYTERDFSDKPSRANLSDVEVSVNPRRSNALVFDHRILHDGDKLNSGSKLLLRTDIVFEKVFA
jgi:hypothetical protein